MRFAVALLAFSLMPLGAQEGLSGFKVDYTIRDGSAQPRRYAVLIEKGGRGNFRVGTRQPYPTGPNNYNYADIGVNIDARLSEGGRGLTLDSNIEISSLQAEKSADTTKPPVIAQVRTNVTNQMPVGRAMVIATIDDPVTLKKFEIEAMLTPVK